MSDSSMMKLPLYNQAVRWWYRDKPAMKHLYDSPVTFGGVGKEREIVVDFGGETGGRLIVDFGETHGFPVHVSFSESLANLYPIGDTAWIYLDVVPGLGMHIYRGSGGERWRDRLLRGGFRYLLLRPLGPLRATINSITVEPDYYVPNDDNAIPGWLECSDERIDRIWRAAAATMQIATKRPYEAFALGCDRAGSGDWHIMDGAKRDRVIWAMDLALCIPSFFQSFADAKVVRDTLVSFLEDKGRGPYKWRQGYVPHAMFPRNRPEWYTNSLQVFSVYNLWWIRGVIFYYMHTGDERFVEEMLPHINGIFDWLETQTKPSPESATPLFYANGHNDLSWDYTVRRKGFSTATNIIWAVVLEEAASVAETLLHTTVAIKWRNRAAAIRIAVFEQGFVPFDLYDPAGKIIRHTSCDETQTPLEANALAVLFDFVDTETSGEILDRLRALNHLPWGSLSSDARFSRVIADTHNRKVFPAIGAFEVAALIKCGRYREAFDLITGMWLPMIDTDPGTTFWEWYGDAGPAKCAPRASLCHPWSAWVLQIINEALTGIRPLAPGFIRFSAVPPGPMLSEIDITNVRCSVPTPHGSIGCCWRKTFSGIEYSLDIPEGCTAIASSPFRHAGGPAGQPGDELTGSVSILL